MTFTQKNINIGKSAEGKRLDIFLTDLFSITRSRAQKIIRGGLVFVGGVAQTKNGYKLKQGDRIEVREGDIATKKDKKELKKIENAFKKIKIIKETDDFLIVEKPAGILVHPTQAGEINTLTDFLVSRYPDIKNVGESENRPGIVHRLDKEASGLLVVARNQKMFEHLKKQFKKRQIKKKYLVLVHGVVEADSDEIDFEIDRGAAGKMVARPKTDKLRLKNIGKILSGKESLTEFFVEKRFARYSLLTVGIKSGRTHQIRVHMLAFGHPVVGDTLYYNKKMDRKRDLELSRLFLHANYLCFKDLYDKENCFSVETPRKLENFLSKLN